MQYELNHQLATITSLNPRTEKHGDKLVPAIDIGIKIVCDNAALDMLHPELKPGHYQKGEPKQGELIEDLRALKFKHYKYPFGWTWEGVGYETYLDYGMNGDQQLHFTGNTVDGFKIECQEGGSIILNLRIIAHPTAEEVGALYELMGKEVDLTLMAPSQTDKEDSSQEPLL